MFITKTLGSDVTNSNGFWGHSSTSDKATDTAVDVFFVSGVAVHHHGDLLRLG